MNFPSKLVEDAVNEFAKLPGIGKKTALRLALHLLSQPVDNTQNFTTAVSRMRSDIRFCNNCHNIADGDLCGICSNVLRDHSTVCVVENLRDVIAIENTEQYRGVFHVLGGVISPIDGIGPEQLRIDSLLEKVKQGTVKEIIMAISPTMEGDTTIFYISRKLQELNQSTKITSIARGVAFGNELEYVDELTLARSIASRLPYESYMTAK